MDTHLNKQLSFSARHAAAPSTTLSRVVPGVRVLRPLVALLLAGVFVVATAQEAHADPGLVLKKASLTVADRQGLEKAVAGERKARPEAFEKVAFVRAEVARMDATKRGRLAPVGRQLRSIGPAGLLPMLELLALEAPSDTASLPVSAQKALRIGLFEAVAALRESRAEPVLVAAAKADDLGPEVGAAAARALGRLASNQSLSTLSSLAKGDTAARRRAAAGLGECRRSASAPLLQGLSVDTDEHVRHDAIRALGQLGNAQAWKTHSTSSVQAEEATTRQTAAEALVPAFVAGDSRARHLASVALMVVDFVGTPALIEKASASADAATKGELDKLAAKFAKNPTR